MEKLKLDDLILIHIAVLEKITFLTKCYQTEHIEAVTKQYEAAKQKIENLINEA